MGADEGSADIVNLRMARKRKARADEQRQAAANRALHGRSKADKARTTAENTVRLRKLDGLKLVKDE